MTTTMANNAVENSHPTSVFPFIITPLLLFDVIVAMVIVVLAVVLVIQCRKCRELRRKEPELKKRVNASLNGQSEHTSPDRPNTEVNVYQATDEKSSSCVSCKDTPCPAQLGVVELEEHTTLTVSATHVPDMI